MKRPNLNALRTFEAAARKLSFSIAADELNITQAAVSQQIRKLETFLGSELFIRNHRQLSLSAVGLAYFRTVQEAIDRLDTVTDQLFPERTNQIVTIRCTSSIATLWLAPNIGAFQREHPEIDLRIQTLDSESSAPKTPKVDLEIFISGKDVADPNTCLLLTSTIAPVASPRLLTKTGSLNNPKDIRALELIHVLGYEDDWHRWFRRFGLKNIAVPRGLAVDGSLIALEAALRGDGAILGRRPFVDQHLQSGQLVEIFLAPYSLTANYYLRQSKSGSDQRSKKRVATWLKHLAENSGQASTCGISNSLL